MPTTTPIPLATVQTKTANVNGLALQVPGTWVSHPHTAETADDGTDHDPWTLHMTDPDGDAEPILAVSDVLPTTSVEQAYQAASALLSSDIPGYQAAGAFTFPTPEHPDNQQQASPPPSPTSAPQTATASPSEEAEPTPSPSAEPTPTAETIARIAFAYKRGETDATGTAWIEPVNGGYVVVVLMDDDDTILAAIETSLRGDGA